MYETSGNKLIECAGCRGPGMGRTVELSPGISICETCISICADIMEKNKPIEPFEPVPLADEIIEALDEAGKSKVLAMHFMDMCYSQTEAVWKMIRKKYPDLPRSIKINGKYIGQCEPAEQRWWWFVNTFLKDLQK
jgi:hypothetical protein